MSHANDRRPNAGSHGLVQAVHRIGPYEVLREVARGGMGVVFQARGPDGRDVALKLLLAQRISSARAYKRYQVELQTLSRLQHPNVVRILAAGEQQGSPWLALEYVEGETLQERLHRGPLPVNEAIRVAQQLARALTYVHSCGVLHRDLKPDNVLLRGHQALLTDFGLALDAEGHASRITATGHFLGTPGYWAPEQALGKLASMGPRTDVYGLGAVLYACLTGHAPVEAGSLHEFMVATAALQITPPRALRAEVPAWLSALCVNCLASEPESRPASAEAVARALISPHLAPASRRRVSPWITLAPTAAALLALAAWAWSKSSAEPTLPAAPLSPPAEQSAPAPAPVAPVAPVSAEPPPRAKRLLEDAMALAVTRDLAAIERSLALLDEALELAPDFVDGYMLRGNAHMALKHHAEALWDLDQAIRLKPKDPSNYLSRGFVQHKLGRFEQAIADYDRVLELDPDEGTEAAAIANRAKSWFSLGRHPEAILDYDRVLALNPRSALTYTNRATSKIKLGRYPEALSDIEQALRLDPNAGQAYAARGMLKVFTGREEEALADYDLAVSLDPTHVLTLASRGTVKLNLGRHEAAIKDFNRALELEPENPLFLVTRGRAKYALERFAAAIEDFDRGLSLDPSDPEGTTFARRGDAKTRLGRHAEAIEDFDHALRLNPNSAKRWKTLDKRGKAKFKLEQFDKAIEDFDHSLELEPNNALARLNRGSCKARLGHLAQAVEDFDEALRLGLPEQHVARARSFRERAAALLGEAERDPQ